MNALDVSIGLEVRLQLATRSKLFSPAPTAVTAGPNQRVHPIDLGLPGTLPRLNRQAVALAVRAALALGCELQQRSRFVRKHYFRPELPKGYLLTQGDEPLARGGRLSLGDGRHCRLQRLHLEEDTGALQHTAAGTLVDYDRAGMPLLAIQSEPDLRSPADAHAFLRELCARLQACGVTDGEAQPGALRCRANLSVPTTGNCDARARVDLDLLDPMHNVWRALDYEQRRVAALLAAGSSIAGEARAFLDSTGESRPLRGRQEPADCRPLLDPDLGPLLLDEPMIASQRAALASADG